MCTCANCFSQVPEKKILVAIDRKIEIALRPQLEKGATDYVLRLVTKGSGELSQFQSAGVSDFHLAELDGKPPQEAIVYVYFYIGEGINAYYLAIYSLHNLNEPNLIICKYTHDEYMDSGYIEVVDLDDDGREEIIVVGDTDGIAPTDLFLYAWKDGNLKDMVWGLNCGVGYLHLDVDGDKKQEIMAVYVDVEKGSQSIQAKILKRDEAGYYRETQSNWSLGNLLVRVFEDVVSTGRVHRPYIDLALLVRGIRESGQSPKGLIALQPKLEALYQQCYDLPDTGALGAIVNAMAWPGNTIAVPFLKQLLTSEKHEKNARGAAAQALVIIGGKEAAEYLLTVLEHQLTLPTGDFDVDFVSLLVRAMLAVGDKRGLDLAIAKAKDPTAAPKARRGIVSWVLNKTEAESTLLDMALTSSDAEIRRRAATNLEHFPLDKSQLKLEELIAALASSDANVRASIALCLGSLGEREAVAALLKALQKEKERWPRRQMVIALGYLKPEGVSLIYRERLKVEKDNEIRNLLLSAMEKAGYEMSEEEVIRGLTTATNAGELKKYIERAGKQQLIAAVPHIISLAQKGRGSFVRETAVQTLANFDIPEAKKVLRELLVADSNRTVRYHAANSLGKLKDMGAEDIFVKALKEEPDAGVRSNAAMALGHLGTEKAVKALVANLRWEFLNSSYWAYVQALVSTDAPESAEALANEMSRLEGMIFTGKEKTLKPYVLLGLADGLWKMGDSRGLKAMSRWIKPDYPEEFRVSVIEHLGRTGAAEAISVIREYANDESRQVRVAVIIALKTDM